MEIQEQSTRTRWMQIRDVIEQASELPLAERDAFVSEACGDNFSLHDAVCRLLALDADVEAEGGEITRVVRHAVENTASDRRKRLLGTRIGPYRLVNILGFGGTGTVYLGERIDQRFSAQVAVKIIDGAPLNSDIARRFMAETRILGQLHHPGIARLIDAGETDDGYPYMIMEYVHGESILKYCDRLKLTIDERIRLAIKVCQAVQYAHQNLVVHRDLKPSNIFVTPDGTPKLLDFGIAKLLDTGQLASELALTRMNDRLLTPEYASPEQILGQNVTTASDVYSLGVILFELLTGLRPYKITGVSQLELERTICLTDVTRASWLVKQKLHAQQVLAAARYRRVTPKQLVTLVTGDLDSILLRALRKEPEQRYHSGEQLADDLRRHLAREPVDARQGHWSYYTSRFIRRHTLGVAIATIFVALLTSALVITSIQSKRIEQQRNLAAHERDVAKRERQTSDAVANFMTTVFSDADPDKLNGSAPRTARELLDAATQRIHDDLHQEPQIRARLLETMGLAYGAQGAANRGVGLIKEALRLRESAIGANNPALATTYLNLGKVLHDYNDANGAKRAFTNAETLLRAAGSEQSKIYAETLIQIGHIKLEQGDSNEARQYYQRTIKLLRSLDSSDNLSIATALLAIAQTYSWQSNLDSAVRYAQDAADIYRATVPELNADRLNAEGALGDFLLAERDISHAAPRIEQTLARKRQVFGNNSTRLLYDLYLMMSLRRAQNNLDDAERYAHEALDIVTARLGAHSTEMGFARGSVGIVLFLRRRYHEAEIEFRAALDIFKVSVAPDHPYIPSTEYYLGETLLALGQHREALLEAESARDLLSTENAASWRIARSENTIGEILWKQQQYAKALPLLEQSYNVLSSSKGPDRDTVRLARKRLNIAHEYYAKSRHPGYPVSSANSAQQRRHDTRHNATKNRHAP